jgi:hypothetical protein
MIVDILNKYFYNDISYIIIEYNTISEDDAVHNKYIVNIHLKAMFDLRQRVRDNKAATFSYIHQDVKTGLDIDLYFKDVLTTMINVKD